MITLYKTGFNMVLLFYYLCLLVSTCASPSRYTTGYLHRLYSWSHLPVYF